VALSEWGLTADVLNEHWTPELLWLMFRERSKEIRRLREMRPTTEREEQDDEPRNVLSDTDLFKKIKGLHYTPKPGRA
jgi:hypothetical protein